MCFALMLTACYFNALFIVRPTQLRSPAVEVVLTGAAKRLLRPAYTGSSVFGGGRPCLDPTTGQTSTGGS